METQRTFHRTFQKGFRRTGNPDLVNDISSHLCSPNFIICGIVRDTEYQYWNKFRCHMVSENFIRKFKSKVNWDYISRIQVLSESFIREFEDQVDWAHISTWQKFSEKFISSA